MDNKDILIKKIYNRIKRDLLLLFLRNQKIYDKWNAGYKRKLKEDAISKGKIMKLDSNGYIASFTNLNSRFYLPLYKTDLIQQTILVHEKYYEQDYLEKYCCRMWNGKVGEFVKGRCVLDVGSNIGSHSLYLFNELKCKKVYAFEPVKETFETLSTNMRINSIECELYNKGVGAESRTHAKLVGFDESNTGGATIAIDEDGDIDIVSIDDLEINDEIAFIKIDTEGFEKSVIDGAIKTIEKNKPFMMIEIDKSNREYVNDRLNPLGYKFEKYDENNCFYYIPDKVVSR